MFRDDARTNANIPRMPKTSSPTPPPPPDLAGAAVAVTVTLFALEPPGPVQVSV
jgi:hypothetical protein